MVCHPRLAYHVALGTLASHLLVQDVISLLDTFQHHVLFHVGVPYQDLGLTYHPYISYSSLPLAPLSCDGRTLTDRSLQTIVMCNNLKEVLSQHGRLS